jgi:hypothetical protein
MSSTNVYFVAEQPIQTFDQVCKEHEIILSRRVLCRALAIQVLEELDTVDQEASFDAMPIPYLLAFAATHNLMIDVYSLKLKLWTLLYHERANLHLPESVFEKPEGDCVDQDTLTDVLDLVCFQDSYEEWMGQPIDGCLRMGESMDTCLATPKVDTIDCVIPDFPMFDAEEGSIGFQENPELASLVSDVLAAETKPKRSRFLTFFTKE